MALSKDSMVKGLGIALMLVLAVLALTAGMASAAEPVTLTAVHSPVVPTTASVIRVTVSASPGQVSDVKVYIDGSYVPTVQSCITPLPCTYVAQKAGLSAGTHTYYAKAYSEAGIVYSNTASFTVSGEVPSIIVGHYPVNPQAGQNLTIVAVPQNGGLFAASIYFDGSILPTTEFCFPGTGVCGFKAVKANVQAGMHTYNATGIFGNMIIASPSNSVKVSESQQNGVLIDYFYANPASVLQGEQSTLYWSVRNARSVSIDKLGEVKAQGSSSVALRQSTTYVLTALPYGDGEPVTKSVTIAVSHDTAPVLSASHTPKQPTTSDKVLFTAVSNRRLANVKIVIDYPGLEKKSEELDTKEICDNGLSAEYTSSISDRERLCRYYAQAQLPAGKVTYHATGYFDKSLVMSESTSFEVSGVSRIGLEVSPKEPTEKDEIVFTITPGAARSSLTQVVVVIDGREINAEEICPINTNSGCPFTASAGALKPGRHSAYARGVLGGSRVVSETVYFTVSSSQKIAFYYLPAEPVYGNAVTIYALPQVRVQSVQIYFDDEPLKTSYTCTSLSGSLEGDKLCKYMAFVTDASAGRHWFYATASTGSGDITTDREYLKISPITR